MCDNSHLLLSVYIDSYTCCVSGSPVAFVLLLYAEGQPSRQLRCLRSDVADVTELWDVMSVKQWLLVKTC